MDKTRRLFIAFFFEESVVSSCVELTEKLRHELQERPGRLEIRWVPRENLHATLVFLGSIPSEEVPILTGLFNSIVEDSKSFPIALQGLGTFSQTLWAGILDLEQGATALAKRFQETFREFGYFSKTKATQDFVPHLTLARIKAGHFPKEILKKYSQWTLGTMSVREIALVESSTLPSGAVYNVIARAELRQ